MENHLEHKIASAYKKKDENFSFENKEKLWGQFASKLGHSKGVAAVWRIVAIIFALLVFGSVFGAALLLKNNEKKINDVQNQNAGLQWKVDSLLTIVPEKITETITIEKEKIVYREANPKLKIEIKEIPAPDYQQEIQSLKARLNHSEYNFKMVKDSLVRVQNELSEFVSASEEQKEENKPEFRLKTEHVPEQMQPVKTGDVPKMKLQIIKIQDNIKYETGSTLLKK